MTPDDYRAMRVENVKEQVNIHEVLQFFGYEVWTVDMEQQFSCDMHGDTVDQNKSARVYPESNSTYCFACGKARDVIDTIRDKLDLKFWESIRFLERHFNVEEIPSAAEFGFENEESEEVVAKKQKEEDIARMYQRAEAILISERTSFAPEMHLRLCHALDALKWDYDKGIRKPEQVLELLDKLRRKSIKLATT